MTEQGWFSATDPQPMLTFLWHKASERKFRLFAVGCCRQIERLLPHQLNQEAVNVAECFADNRASTDELEEVGRRQRSAGPWRNGHGPRAVSAAARFQHLQRVSVETALGAAVIAAQMAAHAMTDKADGGTRSFRDPAWLPLWEEARTAQVSLLRCIFGNPFHPVSVSPAWLTATVTAFAQSIYDERAFDRLPILADALEESGCDDADLLDHCRQPGRHFRGCWAVDLLLGKN